MLAYYSYKNFANNYFNIRIPCKTASFLFTLEEGFLGETEVFLLVKVNTNWKNKNKTKKRLNGKRKQKAYDTRDSQDVSVPSTNRARCCLTSQIGRDGVLSAGLVVSERERKGKTDNTIHWPSSTKVNFNFNSNFTLLYGFLRSAINFYLGNGN